MKKPKICASITSPDINAIEKITSSVDLFEVRIDLIGDAWEEVARLLNKPWIATNRTVKEGGQWHGNEARRIEKLLQAIELGAGIVDVEYNAKNAGNLIAFVKKRAVCLLSFHDFEKTPPISVLRDITRKQIDAGADICKIVTTAQKFEDNLTVLQLIKEFSSHKIVAFAMGVNGILSRLLSPAAGADFTYGAIETGKESAPGQIPVVEMLRLYEMLP